MKAPLWLVNILHTIHMNGILIAICTIDFIVAKETVVYRTIDQQLNV